MAALQTLKQWFRRPLTCEDVNQFIIDYLEETIPPRTRARFETHLKDCATCGSYFDQYLQTVDWIHEDGAAPIEPPEELVEVTLDFLRKHYDDLGSV